MSIFKSNNKGKIQRKYSNINSILQNADTSVATRTRQAALVLAVFCASITSATAAPHQATHQPDTSVQHMAEHAATNTTTSTTTSAVKTAVMTAATVRKIDVAQTKITLKHAAISNIGMPAMTMVFKVADKTLLTGLTVNDEVLFAVEKQGSALVVTALEKKVPAKTE
jgi:Cu(I)/Ag(I) efflux system protein CusF